MGCRHQSNASQSNASQVNEPLQSNAAQSSVSSAIESCQSKAALAEELPLSDLTFAIVGNPNSGKTTLFNELTGLGYHVGNGSDVSDDIVRGKLSAKYGAGNIVSLPAVYSLDSPHDDKRIARNYLINEKPDVVIDVVEATNIERSLFLACQIAELGIPLVIALNMMDEARAEGDVIDCEQLSGLLGLPVIPIAAVKGEGVIELMDVVDAPSLMCEVALQASHPVHEGEDEHGHGHHDTEDPEEHRRDHHTDAEGRTNAFLSEHKYHNHYKGPMVYVAHQNETLSFEQLSDNTERRYAFIKQVCNQTIVRGKAIDEKNTSDKIDRVVTHPVLGIPIFALIMWFMFHCTFSGDFFGTGLPSPGIWLQGLVNDGLSRFCTLIEPFFEQGSVLYGLVFDGALAGVGAVLSFLPQICVLFFFLTMLEDVGYMSRAAFIIDRFLRVFGLSGRSFLPMLMGFGCNVPAMMACRTIENKKERNLTLFLIPFMSCGSRAPIFLVFCAAFFPQNTDLIVLGLYAGGIIVAIFTSTIITKVFIKSETTSLLLELPRYRTPHARSVATALWITVKDYVSRAGTVIFLMSIVVWFLSSFGVSDAGFGMVEMDHSLLALAGNAISVVFSPLGFGFWTAAVVLLTGLLGKEAVVGTLGVLCQMSATEEAVGVGLSASMLTTLGFTPASGMAFMVFCLLYTPCAAALAGLHRESGSVKLMVVQAVYSVVVAWLAAFVTYIGAGIVL